MLKNYLLIKVEIIEGNMEGFSICNFKLSVIYKRKTKGNINYKVLLP